jgi:hypothetical protein
VNPGSGGVIQRRARRGQRADLAFAASASSARCTLRWLAPSASAKAELDQASPSARKGQHRCMFSPPPAAPARDDRRATRLQHEAARWR